MANEQMNPNPEAGINPLEKYGINLTELSKEGKIDPEDPRIRGVFCYWDDG